MADLREMAARRRETVESVEHTDHTEEIELEPATEAAGGAAPAEAAAAAEDAEDAVVAELLPMTARRVVLFGCGRGIGGAAFLRRQPAARLYGVTERRADVAAAAERLTAAVCGTPETVDLAAYGLAELDCIAFAAGAAAVVSQESLQRHAAALAQTGQMVFVVRQAPDALVAMLRAVGLVQFFVDRLQGREDGAMVVRAVKQRVPSMSVQTLLGETIVTARLRALLPSKCLATVPGVFARVHETSLNGALAQQMQSSVVIRQRRSYQSVEEGLERTERLRQGGHVIVYEMDDNPILWEERNARVKHMDFVGAHAVQASTPALAEVLRQYNPHVYVMENQLWELPEPRDYEAEERESGGRVVVFFGALNREKDWQDILPALNRAAAKYRGKIFFRVLADRKFYEALETEDKEFLRSEHDYDGKFVSYEVYERALHGSDIALLPLRNTAFNQTKSDLKFIESAGHGAVVLASPTVYARTVADGCTGCLYRDAEMFETKLERLVEHSAYRHAIARSAYAYVKEHRLMSQHYMERVNLYRYLVAHHEELDQDLVARLEKVRKG
ncbi:glycosyltransferase [uncultured Selenomonas sp.]|uniref:glycosyltransferase family protein n=1 Tax=uncultured Selenomonas sp. TaxID=159275 RepID=UPI0025E17D7E|nr:glycosyltransferase [uncultured Selenomonas sp.]